jgi:lysophospholipase L1-like esterase
MEAARKKVVYVALGDSTGVGVGAREGGGYVARLFKRIERERPGSKLVNLCVSGATTADVLREQTSRVAAHHPTLITLGIGINDIGRQVPLEQFARNYAEITAQLVAHKQAVLVVSNLPDISAAPVVPVFMRDEAQRRIALFNAKIEEITSRHDLHVADAHSLSREVLHEHPEYFSADGFHPSDAGYEFWAETMWPTIERAIKSASEVKL